MHYRAQYHMRGFTLIEVLVVMVIMSIMLGLVVVNFAQDDKQKLQQEGHRLALLLNHASTTARSTGKSIAWVANRQSYHFMQLAQNGQYWEASTISELRLRHLPDNSYLEDFKIAGIPAKFNEMLIFTPSGMNPAFSVQLKSDHAWLNIEGNMLGQTQDYPAQEIE